MVIWHSASRGNYFHSNTSKSSHGEKQSIVRHGASTPHSHIPWTAIKVTAKNDAEWTTSREGSNVIQPTPISHSHLILLPVKIRKPMPPKRLYTKKGPGLSVRNNDPQVCPITIGIWDIWRLKAEQVNGRNILWLARFMRGR